MWHFHCVNFFSHPGLTYNTCNEVYNIHVYIHTYMYVLFWSLSICPSYLHKHVISIFISISSILKVPDIQHAVVKERWCQCFFFTLEHSAKEKLVLVTVTIVYFGVLLTFMNKMVLFPAHIFRNTCIITCTSTLSSYM